MKFVLLVEGSTEKLVLGDFIRTWLNRRTEQGELKERVGVQVEPFSGWHHLIDEVAKKTKKQLNDPKNYKIIAVISLLDLYGPDKAGFYPDYKKTVQERYAWGKKYIEEDLVKEPQKFRHFFAVHETEAWLLSQPDIFPDAVKKALPKNVAQPETVNFNNHPSQLLERLYRDKIKQAYIKTTTGPDLFRLLDPDIAYNKCPHLKEMLDEMLKLAKAAGL